MLKKLVLLLLVVCVGATVYVWQNRDVWLAQFNRDMAQQAQAQRERGAELGRTTDQQGCLDATLKQFNTCFGYECTVANGQFLKACWAQAQTTPDFCADTPEFREEPTEDDKSWAKFYCIDRNIRDAGCQVLMRQKQQLCASSN